ncbi:MAG: phosphate transport system regulatory protein PhoU [Actinobacteria bacterium]|nr:phosphate transport system regulatory protein PhoU [Actinomycetota bacterium]|tara:strand:- start:140 stop:823 length:684 start_codon:yes stop_codon:yes gene_type:complete
MSSPLEKAIKDLNVMFLNYCAEVEQNVHLAVQSFMKTEPKNIQIVMDKDRQIDQLEIAIEEECLRIMAVYQPLAKDLRFIVGILKMNNDLERIGDLAVNIVKKVTVFSDRDIRLSEYGGAFFLPEMIQKSLNMLKKSLDSFTQQDPELAREVCLIDDEVDALKQEMKVLVLNKMKESPEQISTLSSILRNSYHLERISDLSTNIAEDVIYWVDGDIIRHGGFAHSSS